jgi:hypothetical protein
MLQLPLGWTLLPQEPRSEISSLDVYGVWNVSEVGYQPLQAGRTCNAPLELELEL